MDLFCEFWVDGVEDEVDDEGRGLLDALEVEDEAEKAEVVLERFERV